jgi:hypothetical protein
MPALPGILPDIASRTDIGQIASRSYGLCCFNKLRFLFLLWNFLELTAVVDCWSFSSVQQCRLSRKVGVPMKREQRCRV